MPTLIFELCSFAGVRFLNENLKRTGREVGSLAARELVKLELLIDFVEEMGGGWGLQKLTLELE